MLSIEFLLQHSGLPGPRANLALLHRFFREADASTAAECLAYASPRVSNSPEEFAAMCGVAATAWLKRGDRCEALAFLKPYASHASWRVRESVAIVIQEMSVGSLAETLVHLEFWASGSALERRAVAAAICEPKLLKSPAGATEILRITTAITLPFDHDRQLTPDEDSLRKTLGYGWSVVVVAYPEAGKTAFEALLSFGGRHIAWIVRENLKKDRLSKMDAAWVEALRHRIGP